VEKAFEQFRKLANDYGLDNADSPTTKVRQKRNIFFQKYIFHITDELFFPVFRNNAIPLTAEILRNITTEHPRKFNPWKTSAYLLQYPETACFW